MVRMGGGRLALFSRRRKCRRYCAFLESDMVLVVQVRSSVMCTPRNLVLLTLSTVELSMVSGGWSVEFLLLKSITTFFVFSTLRDRLLAPRGWKVSRFYLWALVHQEEGRLHSPMVCEVVIGRLVSGRIH